MLGTGPFGQHPAGSFNREMPERRGLILFEDSPRRIRGVLAGETVVDSTRVKLLHEHGHLPIYYFPREDVRFDLLEPTDHHTRCPWKGEASYWSLRVGDRVAENAVWGYPEPLDDAPPLAELRRVLLEQARHLVRGGRGGDRPPARPVSPRRRAAELAPRRRAGRRRGDRREHAPGGAVRDGAADALVPAGRGRADGAARAVARSARGVRTRALPPTGRWAARRTSCGRIGRPGAGWSRSRICSASSTSGWTCRWTVWSRSGPRRSGRLTAHLRASRSCVDGVRGVCGASAARRHPLRNAPASGLRAECFRRR